jgi:hypothetical protein
MEALAVIKFISLMMTVWFTWLVMIKTYRGQEISWFLFALTSFFVTMFIFLTFNLFWR